MLKYIQHVCSTDTRVLKRAHMPTAVLATGSGTSKRTGYIWGYTHPAEASGKRCAAHSISPHEGRESQRRRD